MSPARRLVLLGALSSASACTSLLGDFNSGGDASAPVDGSHPKDGAHPSDASHPKDAPRPSDGGPTTDGGRTDAGPSDAMAPDAPRTCMRHSCPVDGGCPVASPTQGPTDFPLDVSVASGVLWWSAQFGSVFHLDLTGDGASILVQRAANQASAIVAIDGGAFSAQTVAGDTTQVFLVQGASSGEEGASRPGTTRTGAMAVDNRYVYFATGTEAGTGTFVGISRAGAGHAPFAGSLVSPVIAIDSAYVYVADQGVVRSAPIDAGGQVNPVNIYEQDAAASDISAIAVWGGTLYLADRVQNRILSMQTDGGAVTEIDLGDTTMNNDLVTMAVDDSGLYWSTNGGGVFTLGQDSSPVTLAVTPGSGSTATTATRLALDACRVYWVEGYKSQNTVWAVDKPGASQ